MTETFATITAAIIVGRSIEAASKHGRKLIETIWTQWYGPILAVKQRKAEQQIQAIDRAEELDAIKHQAEVAQYETALTLLKREEKAFLKKMGERVEARAEARTQAESIQDQINLESTIRTAYIIADESNATPSEEPVDNDWFRNWKDGAKNYSSEEMQQIYARILAGEVQKPGSFSPQTLNIVRNLSPKDAKVFTVFCSNVWEWGPKRHLIPLRLTMQDPEPLTYLEMEALVHLGLINRNFLGTSSQDKSNLLMGYFGKWFVCDTPKLAETSLSNVTLTRGGMELFSIAGAKRSAAVEQRTLESFANDGNAFVPVEVTLDGERIVSFKKLVPVFSFDVAG